MRSPFTTCCLVSASGLLAVVLIAGCGGGGDKWTKGRPPVYPVSGQVLVDGQPVGKATVTFQPTGEGGKPGFALTDDNGYFEVQTFEAGDGLTEGTHRVAIRKTVMVDPSGNVVELVVDDGGGLTEEHVLPEKYAEFTTSGIEVTIDADGTNELEPFNLADDGNSTSANR